MDQQRYYVLNGRLIRNSDHQNQDVLIDDVSELETIKAKLEPGAIAHLAGNTETYELSPTKTWVKVV